MRPHRRSLVSLLLLGTLVASAVQAQGVGVNTTGAPADTSALLDLVSTSKGLLPPRMTAAQRGAIVLPATGLVVFQTDGTSGLYYNGGTPASPNWLPVAGSGGSGSPWTVSGSNLYYTPGAVSIGTTGVAARLTIEDPTNGLRVQTDNTGSALASFGGSGTFFVDAPYVTGGRLAILENGNTGIGVTSPATRLDVLGGNYDVTNGEGDVRVGSPSYRLKLGVATGGSNAGDARIMQMGQAGGYNVLSLGAQGNRVVYVNGSTQRVGIGTDVPTAPLGFPATLTHKITLYPGATGDAGLGMTGNRVQIYSDNPNADVALGYDAAGTFNERFAFKPTGALAVNGSTGTAGQVLQTNGASSAATWVSPTNAVYNSAQQGVCVFGTTLNSNSPETTVPNLSLTVYPPSPCRALITAAVPVQAVSCNLCGSSHVAIELKIDGTLFQRFDLDLANGADGLFSTSYIASLTAGSHTIALVAEPTIGPSALYGAIGSSQGILDVLQFPQ